MTTTESIGKSDRGDELGDRGVVMEPNGYCHPCGKRIRGSAKRRIAHGLRHLAEELQDGLDRRKEAA